MSQYPSTKSSAEHQYPQSSRPEKVIDAPTFDNDNHKSSVIRRSSLLNLSRLIQNPLIFKADFDVLDAVTEKQISAFEDGIVGRISASLAFDLYSSSQSKCAQHSYYAVVLRVR